MHSKTHHEHQKGSVCNFFTNQGPAIQIAIPKSKFVNARFYEGNVFHKLKKYFLSRQPATGLRGVRLLHDNASPHKAAIVSETGKGYRSCPL